MNNVGQIAKKEFSGFFYSLTGLIFFGSFLACTLFIFFWVETFFARNIADVRPMFEWFPILLIFLVPALTMRMWSEEKSTGTLEILLTSSISNLQLVMGKFLACLALVSLAVSLTLPLPFTVSMLGPLDWGPVFGGYLATIFLAGAYSAIGLYISAKTSNQIVSLIFSVLLCGAFYLVGSDGIQAFFDNQVGELLALLGTGARFESITRGVIDFRDIYYYLSIIGVFLSLNVLALERMRWANNPRNNRHSQWLLITALFVANFIVGNFWIQRVAWARVDLTAGQIYSISGTTKKYLSRLKEPLLIRGYFSASTHPKLAPLVPRLRDLLKEYELAGKNKVKVEFVDPLENQEVEKEINQKYGIQPKPFQTSNKYQASIANSYFDILVKYGDQFEKLSFDDLIDVKVSGDDLEVDLRNPEYDITSTIKKVLVSYQGSGDVFATLEKPVKFTGYISSESTMPEQLVTLKNSLIKALSSTKKESSEKFSFQILDPAANGGAVAQQIEKDYGFKPMAVGLLDSRRFWFYMTMSDGSQVVQIPLPEDLSEAGLDRGIKAGLKRFSKGFLKTIGLVLPKPKRSPYGGKPEASKHFSILTQQLSEQYSVKPISFVGGIPEDIDLLLLLSPEGLDEKQVFMVDQFLMQGGTVILSSSPFDINMQNALSCHRIKSGLSEWLKHHGMSFEDTVVLDAQNSVFPIPVQKDLGGLQVQQTFMIHYPYFVDVRNETGMDNESGLIAGLRQVTVNWPSPIKLDDEKNTSKKFIKLLSSSSKSWTSSNLDIQPNLEKYGELGFEPPNPQDLKSRLISVAAEGEFSSFFKGKQSPLKNAQSEPGKPAGAAGKSKSEIVNVLEKSTKSAKIILFGSNTFLSDEMLELASAGMQTRYLNPAELVLNAVDWSLGDRDLLSIRGRAQFSRTLQKMDKKDHLFWEYLNYGLACLGLLVVGGFRHNARSRSVARTKQILGESMA